jgi:hypothetical protein
MAIKPGLVLDGGLTAKDRWARESRWNEGAMPNSVPVNSLRIEDEHEQEDDLVADLGVSSAERYAAPCTSAYLCAKAN